METPTGFKVPRAIRVVDQIFMHPEKLFSRYEFEKGQKELTHVRHKALEKIGSSLNPAIRQVFKQI